ncbi:MAG TPA: hypothetical protein EYQ07_04460 [Candidatus Poseidoniales archaeon]|nr:hypothetical protein [Candidatus Poseidoniales archaeon]
MSIIQGQTRGKTMTTAQRVNELSSITIAILMLTMSAMGFFLIEEQTTEKEQLAVKEMPRFATSPGHSVFGEYVGAHWCGPCMDSAAPSLVNLKSSNGEDFTFVSFFESSSGGWPSDGPIYRTDHVMAASSGYPTFGFADAQSGTCYKVGSAGTDYYDADYSAGGCMGSDASEYAMELSTALNSAGDEVTITVEVTYLGSSALVVVYLYGAVTEQIGGDAYDNGNRPHNNWREWLLNSDNNGFEQLTLTPNNVAERTWTVPLNTVRAAGGNTQFENFWPVLALMDGPHASYNTFLSAVDLDMIPLVDIGVSDFQVENQNGNLGFVPGDILDVSVEITNNGVDPYNDGGEIAIYELQGLDEIYIGGASIANLATAGTQTLTVDFDTSQITPYASGATTFRAMLLGLTADRVSPNDYADDSALHDMPPIANRPSVVGAASVERGTSIQFESTALANDLVDDMSSMSPALQYALHATEAWDTAWISSVDLVGSGGNARYIHTLSPPMSATSGTYDVRIQWTDAGSQTSDWLLTEDAFELRNALPTVLTSSDNGYAGIPTVKVETDEIVSIIGLLNDAETPLSMLTMDSNAPEFIEFDAYNLELTVNFANIVYDSHGTPLAQGIFVTISDGEDSNSGTILFNVIENGQPRWSGVPTQSFDEGGSASLILTPFLSDTNDNGDSMPASGLALTVVEISDTSLVDASITGHSLNVESLDDDSFGMVEITVRASDGFKESDTIITYHVNNINDAPRIDTTGIDTMLVQLGERITINVLDIVTDIDDPDEEIWITVTTYVPGAVLYNPISGMVTMSWDEAGEEIVTITAEDRHGQASAEMLIVQVVDALLLEWDDGSGNGDIVVNMEPAYFGANPAVTLESIADFELSDIKVIWTVCNTITGICSDFGNSYNFGPFIILANGGDGLAMGDYITLEVTAVDSNGFDRSTEEQYKVYATEPPIDTEVEAPSDDPTDEKNGALTPMTMGMMTIGVLLSLALVMVLAITIRRQKEGSVEYDYADQDYHGYAVTVEDSPLTEAPPPPPGMAPPLPPEGLPAGWTMEQWIHYGAEYLQRREEA